MNPASPRAARRSANALGGAPTALPRHASLPTWRVLPGAHAPPSGARRCRGKAPRRWGTRLDELSPREREIFDLLVRSHSNREIAKRLYISVKTVETHRASINRKLRVHSTAEIIRFAALRGLVHE